MAKGKADPAFLRPRLRLFLSADIVGSTALKQSPSHLVAQTVEWFPILQMFYIEAQREFLSSWSGLAVGEKRDKDVDWGPAPEFWKVIGDEILFTKELTNSRQVANTLRCWVGCIHSLRETIKKYNPRLDVKCTAWTAGFPLLNKEVALPRVFRTDYAPDANYYKEAGKLLNRRYARGGDAAVAVDYIGPSIDIGFRLSQYASPRRFMISVGVAHILSLRNADTNDDAVYGIRYEGSEALKGVFGGARYPKFWIDMAKPGDIDLLEDTLAPRDPINLKNVHAYCKKFFEEAGSYTFAPFIDSSTENDLRVKPDHYAEAIVRLRQNYELEVLGDKKSEKAAEKAVPPPDKASVQVPQGVSVQGVPDTPLSVATLDFVELFQKVQKISEYAIAARGAAAASRPSAKTAQSGNNPRPVRKKEEED